MMRIFPLVFQRRIAVVAFLCSVYAWAGVSRCECAGNELENAESVFDEGYYDTSIMLLEKFIKKNPSHEDVVQAKLYLAKSFYYKKQYARTVSLLDEILSPGQAGSFNDQALLWKAKVLYAQGRFSDAAGALDPVLSSANPSRWYWEACFLKAHALAQVGLIPQAQKFLERVIDSSRESSRINEAYRELFILQDRHGRYAELDAIVQKYLSLFPQGQMRGLAYFYDALSSHHQGAYAKALAACDKALAAVADASLKDKIISQRALTLTALGRYIDAEVNIVSIKDRPRADITRALCLIQQEKYARALDVLDSFIARFAGHEEENRARLYKADCLYATGRIKDALYEYTVLSKDETVEDTIIRQARYGIASCYRKDGEPARAREMFQNLLSTLKEPRMRAQTLLQLADLSYEQGDYKEALIQYNAVDSLFGEASYSDYIVFQKGLIYVHTARWQDAVRSFSAIQETYASSRFLPGSYYYLSLAEYSRGDWEKALSVINTFIESWGTHALSFKAHYLRARIIQAQGRPSDALDDFQYIRTHSHEKSLRELATIDYAGVLIAAQKPDRAREVLMKFLREFPESAKLDFVYLRLAQLDAEAMQYRRARSWCRKLIRRFPESGYVPEALMRMADAFFSDGAYADAAGYYTRVPKTSPFLGPALLQRARLASLEGNKKQALALYNECLRLEGGSAQDALIQKSFLLKELKRYPEAAAAFIRMIKEGLDTVESRLALGFCLEKLKRYDEAIEQYNRIVYDLDETDEKIKAYFRIARIYERTHDTAGAVEIYKKIISYNRQESKIAASRIKALERSGTY